MNQTSPAVSIRPFTVEVPQSQVDDLRSRIAATRWADQLPGAPWERGVPQDYLRETARYWVEDFDWRAAEARLNAHPQLVAEVDGQQIHFLHVRSPEPGATPLVLLHGWPGSVVEFLGVIGPLSDPRGHGLDPSVAFDLVIPSLPGFGWSPLSGPGWNSTRTAQALDRIMVELGYERYGAQGGDFGAFIAPDLGRVAPERVIGVHVNAATYGFIPFGPPDPADLASFTEVEKERLARLEHYQQEQNGYFQVQATRPQTIAYALADSPVGQLAWIIEKFHEWTNDAAATPQEAVALDDILADVSVYWFTGTAGSSANTYYEAMHTHSWPGPSQVPTGVAVFAQDVAIRRYGEESYHIVHWSDIDTGGHFAALEAPDELVADVRTFFSALRP